MLMMRMIAVIVMMEHVAIVVFEKSDIANNLNTTNDKSCDVAR